MEMLLGAHDFNVYSTDDAEEAVDLARMYDYDLLLLGDVVNAHAVLTKLRAVKIAVPILRLAADMQVAVVSLNAGADDVVSRPFLPAELVARIHAIVRRSKGHAQSLIQVRDLVVNLDTKTVSVAGRPVHLTGKEYAMLELMALRKGSLITKEMFLNHLYGGMDEPEIKIIDVFICKLRKKLFAATEGRDGYVDTVWGRGYVLAGGEVDSPSLAPEIRDTLETASELGPQYVTRNSPQEAISARGKHFLKSPPLVPAAGQK
jgi:two-component system cell cycle response regulator CtrA